MTFGLSQIWNVIARCNMLKSTHRWIENHHSVWDTVKWIKKSDLKQMKHEQRHLNVVWWTTWLSCSYMTNISFSIRSDLYIQKASLSLWSCGNFLLKEIKNAAVAAKLLDFIAFPSVSYFLQKQKNPERFLLKRLPAKN